MMSVPLHAGGVVRAYYMTKYGIQNNITAFLVLLLRPTWILYVDWSDCLYLVKPRYFFMSGVMR